MFKDITLGQYFPGESSIHRLDPRTKIWGMILYIVAVFLIKSIWLFIPAALFVIFITLCASVPLSYLWRMFPWRDYIPLLCFFFFFDDFLCKIPSPFQSMRFVERK